MTETGFEVFVKNGDYGYDNKSGTYKEIDFSLKTEDFAEALREFLDWVGNIALDEVSNKVTLSYRFKAKK